MIPTLRSSTLLDRQSHKRADAAYIAAVAREDDARFLVLVEHKPVIVSNEARDVVALRWFTAAELERCELERPDLMFLGLERDSGAGRFAVAFSEHRVKASPAAWAMFRPSVDLRTLAMQGVMASDELSLAGQAKALAHWHDGARCCGRCGGIMHVKDGGWRRKCWACGASQFPRTDPVVIMLIEHPDRTRCLLGRSGRFATGMYSALAGFVEPGEDIEDAVRREVFEEAGIEVGEVRFHSAQPWPFPHTLMIGCLGHATTTDLVVDREELEDARWFTREETQQILAGTHPLGVTGPGRQAIARALITSFAEGRS